MKTKLVVEVVAPIDTKKEFRNRDNALRVNPEATVSVSVKIGEKFGTMKIDRSYEWKKSKPVYDLDFSDNLRKSVNAAEELKTVEIDDSAPIAEYERARVIAQDEYTLQRAKEQLDQWTNHPVRAFQRYVEAETLHKFVMNPKFTQKAFLDGSLSSYEERTYLEVTYGSRKWQYKVGFDEYRTDNSGKSGKLTLSCECAKGDKEEKDRSYCESRFNRRTKYSKKVGEIVRYMEEDIEAMKSRVDQLIKDEAKELAQIAKISAQWKVEGGILEDIEDNSFSIIMDKKKSSSSWNTTAKKIDVELKGKHYEIGSIEAQFTKAQIEQIIKIVKEAQVTTY